MTFGDVERSFHPVAAIFPLMDGEEFEALVEDVKENGQREPIILHPSGSILDGRNRYRACREAGVEPQFRAWDGVPGAEVAYVVSLNLRRRHLDESQRAMVAARIATLKNGQKKSPSPIGEASQAEAAAMLNVGKRTVERARAVLTQGASELVAAVEAGRVAVSAAAVVAEAPVDEQRAVVARGEKEILAKAMEIKKRKVEAKRAAKFALAAELDAEPVPPPTGPFRVIVIDPPWQYDSRADDPTHRSATPYPTMSLPQIAALPVPDLAHDDAVLWLWTTNAFLHAALGLVDEWGFTAKTVLTWVKNTIGLGDWLRGRTEHSIMAVRGRPIVTLTNQSTALIADVREHSRKPAEFYALVESLCPGSKLEMFARERREGWQAWGAETGKFHVA